MPSLTFRRTGLAPALAMFTALAALPLITAPAWAQSKPISNPMKAAPGDNAIVAVVNGDVISRADVDNRRRLFALSTGQPITSEVLDRLTAQVTRELIDEKLRIQESQRRHVIVQDKEVAAAIADIEARNNMQHGQLAKQLAASGVEMRTLVDQFRAQIAWGRVLRQEIGEKGPPSEADVADRQAQFQAQIGQPEYRLSEIFTPVSNPAQDLEAQHFADTIIQQLRAGASFAVVAAQFSQSQTALQGGDLGWEQGNQLDPSVLRVVSEMPVGAVSNPIKVAGGYTIITLRAKREIGKEFVNILTIREAWLPFTSTLNPTEPTQQQIDQLQKAHQIIDSVHNCDDVEAANKAAGNSRPSNPGDIVLEQLSNPQMRSLLTGLQPGHISPPLPSPDGIALIMVCTRDTKNVGIPSKEELLDRIIGERLELTSRQLLRDLQRTAVIDMRS